MEANDVVKDIANEAAKDVADDVANANDAATKSDPGPVKEAEVDNPVKDISDTGDLTFHPFPKLPLEVREMIWDYGIDLTTSPSLVNIKAQTPIFPLLTHVCREARAACLKRYSVFRNARLVARLQEFGMKLTEEGLRKFPDNWRWLSWIDCEKDTLYIDVDIIAMTKQVFETQRRIGRLYISRLAVVKKLAFDSYTACNLIRNDCDIWQTLAVYCPRLTDVTIFTNGADFGNDRYDFSTGCRDISQRITKQTMDEALASYFYSSLKSSLATSDTLSYEIGFARLELDEMPVKPDVPEPKVEQESVNYMDEIENEDLSAQWVCE